MPDPAEDAIARVRRLHAIGILIGASEVVGAHGLHLTDKAVDDMPDKVLDALQVLGVTDREIFAADTGQCSTDEACSPS